MSRATEIAEREAAEAEAEEPDEPETGDDGEEEEAEEEAAPQTVSAPPVTEAQLKRIGEQIGREDDRHEKRMREILGDLWEGREVCPLCMQEGFVIPAQPGEFDPMQRAAVLAAMGDDGTPQYRENPDTYRCDLCDGWGKLLTGSRNPGIETDSCPKCGGQGYLRKDAPSQNITYLPQQPPAQPWNEPQYAPVPNTDQWGRPAGHQHWGQDPAMVGAG